MQLKGIRGRAYRLPPAKLDLDETTTVHYVGIDPGLSGAIASLKGSTLSIVDMPLIAVNASKEEVDGSKLSDLLKTLRPDLIVIEQVGVQPRWGARSCFTFGTVFGVVLGVIQALRLPHLRITPQTWKGEILKGTDRSKEAAVSLIQRLYPKASLLNRDGEVSHDRAEAACMALYGKRKHK